MFVLKLIPFRSDISLLISTCTCPHRAYYRVVSLFSTSARCIVAFRISNPRNTISTGVFEMQNRQLFIALRSDLIIWGRFCQFSFLFAKLMFARRLYRIPSSFFPPFIFDIVLSTSCFNVSGYITAPRTNVKIKKRQSQIHFLS